MRKYVYAIGLIGLAGLVLIFWTIDPAVSSAAERADGLKLFVDSGCQTCHAVSSAGLEAKIKAKAMQGPDMVDLGKRFKADWLAQYLKQEVELEGKSHKKPFKGTDEELQALVDWLLEQKSK